MTVRSKIFLFTAAVLSGGALFAYVYSPVVDVSLAKAAETGEVASTPGPQVPVAEVVTRVMAPWAEFTGMVAAPSTIELRPRVGGMIESAHVPEGGFVERGQLLFQIDPRPFEVALQNARAQKQRAEVLLAQAETDLVVPITRLVIEIPLPAGLAPQQPDAGRLTVPKISDATGVARFLPFQRIKESFVVERNQKIIAFFPISLRMVFAASENQPHVVET